MYCDTNKYSQHSRKVFPSGGANLQSTGTEPLVRLLVIDEDPQRREGRSQANRPTRVKLQDFLPVCVDRR